MQHAPAKSSDADIAHPNTMTIHRDHLHSNEYTFPLSFLNFIFFYLIYSQSATWLQLGEMPSVSFQGTRFSHPLWSAKNK